MIWRGFEWELYALPPSTYFYVRELTGTAQTRPIVFVCHSLGGLVVKQALIVANSYKHNERHPTLAAIFMHTAGVIFMGTPHRGSSKEPYGDVIAKIAKLALQQPNKQLLQTLRQDSHILEGQRNDFTTISRDMEIVCVREEKATGIGMVSSFIYVKATS